MKIERVFTKENQSVFDTVKWKKINVEIKNEETQETLLSLKDLEFPENFSQNACNIIAKMYFRKKGVPETEHEVSFRQLVHRLTNFWVLALIDEKLVAKEDYQIFYDEIAYGLLHQMWAPNSPQWFNSGLYHSYGLIDNKQQQFKNFGEGVVVPIDNNYKYPQSSACFITNIEDKLFGPESITDNLTTATKLFRFGSGVGTNWSKIRAAGEALSNGGVSSGVMSFLKVFDTNAGVIKSGGTTRRSAVMNILDVDHPDILDFIQWKANEENKVFRLQEAGYEVKLNGGAYDFVSGQNVNNSVMIPDDFIRKAHGDFENRTWLKNRVDGSIAVSIPVDEIFNAIAESAWRCGDPGVQFKDRINLFNTCANDGEIVASNPCSEYLFLNNTACNLASINLLKFVEFDFNLKKTIFKLNEFLHTVRLIQLVLDATIHWGSYPTRRIADETFKYRTTGLGFSNLGATLMAMGLEYGAEDSLNVAGLLSSLLTGQSYLVSSEMAEEVGTFYRYKLNREPMKNVIALHSDSSLKYEYTDTIFLNSIDCKKALKEIWLKVVKASEETGFRNAQVTCMAPTGTIGFAMDCISTSVEPVYSHIIYKRVVDGSMIKTVNEILSIALLQLGYESETIKSILKQVLEGTDIFDIQELKEEDKKKLRTVSCKEPISPEQHIWMVAAITPNISGGISKTINLPNNCTAEKIREYFKFAWAVGCKCITVYRDGSKAIQPLGSTKKEKKEKKVCSVCGSSNLSQSGTCGYCKDCGASTGCS